MDTDTQKAVICGLLIFVGLLALMAPFLHYVRVGWRAKRKDIMDGLDADARLAYFEMFSRNGKTQNNNTASTAFELLYDEWYGRQLFFVPGLLLFLVGSITVTSIVLTGLHRLGYMVNPLFDMPDIGMAAIAGAYLWVIDDHISRARRLDFAPSDVQWSALRLIVAVPMGYAFAAVAAKSVGPFVAFALGAFPLATLTSMLRRLSEKSLGLGATTVEASDDIIKLQGINRTIVERLSSEGITTVTQIAYCDPIRLVMRSNLNFNFVTDCMNQALAWMYFQDDLNVIRPLGMRGAAEIMNLIDAYDDTANVDHQRAVAAFPKIADAIKQDPVTLQVAFHEIAEDPYTIFLSRVWS